MEEYETVNKTYIPMNKRAGWVNIYNSEKVQAEIDSILASTDEFDKMLFQDDRMIALNYIIKEYHDEAGPESLNEILETP